MLTFTSPASNPGRSDEDGLSMPQILAAFSYALDLTEGQPLGHAERCCVAGMNIGREMGLPEAELQDLYYALLLKDAGCSANSSKMFHLLGSDEISAKRDIATTDWSRLNWESLQYSLDHLQKGRPLLTRVRALAEMGLNRTRIGRDLVHVRCERGAEIARRLGLSEAAAEAIYSLDELWNGRGHPQGRRGEEIPRLSRIMSFAQSLDVFYVTRGASAAEEMARHRRGRWFDPDVVEAFQSLQARGKFWEQMHEARATVTEFAPRSDMRPATDSQIENICLAFADIVDAKSPFTYRHSAGVAGAAVAMARTMGIDERDITLIRRAALLHDLGKLSVSNAILEKPGQLDTAEWEIMKGHPYYTYEILRRVPQFELLAEIAASHHEKLDGSGYFRGYQAEQLPLAARILVVADIYDALAARRPYRDAMPIEKVFRLMKNEIPAKIDGRCVEALNHSHPEAQAFTSDLLGLSSSVASDRQSCPANEPAHTASR
jgi:putative nucleotidyltransferase with HDIG domain